MTSTVRSYAPTARYALIAALLCLAQPAPVFSQALPWQQQPASQPQGTTQQHRHKVGKNNPPPEAYAAPQGDQREMDDRHLNELATRYYNISAKDPHGVEKLKKLQKDVKNYQASLHKRTYDASDIIKDARKLAGRIAAQTRKLETQAPQTPASPAPTAR